MQARLILYSTFTCCRYVLELYVLYSEFVSLCVLYVLSSCNAGLLRRSFYVLYVQCSGNYVPVFLFMLSLLYVLGAVCFMCAVCAIVTQCWLVREQLLCSMYWAQAGQTCHCVFRLAKSVELIPQFHMPL